MNSVINHFKRTIYMHSINLVRSITLTYIIKSAQSYKRQTRKSPNIAVRAYRNVGGADGTRTRDPRRDRPVF